MSSAVEKAFEIFSFAFLHPVGSNSGFSRKVLLVILIILYLVFSLASSLYFLPLTSSLTFLNVLLIFQSYVHIFISFFLAIDYLIRGSLLSDHFQTFNSTSKLMFIANLMILVVVRVMKLMTALDYLYGFIAMLAPMVPELVASANDFLFSLCVVELTSEVRSINEVLKLKKLDSKTMNKVNKMIEKHLEVSGSLKQLFSPRLFVTLLYHFIELTIALYWIFIRIAHNHFNKIEGYTTFIYMFQPVYCLSAVFGSVHGYVKQVRRLPS
jgi:hypothetical protein